jgi:hypothetical protein
MAKIELHGRLDARYQHHILMADGIKEEFVAEAASKLRLSVERFKEEYDYSFELADDDFYIFFEKKTSLADKIYKAMDYAPTDHIVTAKAARELADHIAKKLEEDK